MALPALAPRVKEGHELTGHRIDARDIRPFVFVVMETAPWQVLQDRLAPVLLRDDVVQLER
jgi:hypothetical protein